MLIGYTDNMTDQQVSELADWADYHAKDVQNPSWKRAFSLIREGADLLLRKRAGRQNDPPVEEGGVCSEPSVIKSKPLILQLRTDIRKTEGLSMVGFEERRKIQTITLQKRRMSDRVIFNGSHLVNHVTNKPVRVVKSTHPIKESVHLPHVNRYQGEV